MSIKLFNQPASRLILFFIAFLFFFSSVYTVQEGKRGVLLRLGEIVTDKEGKPVLLSPGLGFKIPLIYQIRLFDVRLQTLAVQSSRILTQEQKYVLVDYYIKWRIENLALYYQRTGGDALRTQTLLQQQVNDALRTAFGQRTIAEMLSGGRVNLMELLKDVANKTAKNLGVNVADVRIKSIDLPEEVSEKVFTRMRTKREQVATEHRADGRASAEAIKASADGQAAVTIAEAKTKAANLRAEGSAIAAHIYAQAYSKNPEFYAFYRSLEAYKTAFANKNDFILLTPESEFFKYFNKLVPAAAAHTEVK
jgi:membrane protease subunit HflC